MNDLSRTFKCFKCLLLVYFLFYILIGFPSISGWQTLRWLVYIGFYYYWREKKSVITLNVSLFAVFSSFSSGLIFGILVNSTLLLRFYFFHFTWFLLRYNIIFGSLLVTFSPIAKPLLVFLFHNIFWCMFSVRFEICSYI